MTRFRLLHLLPALLFALAFAPGCLCENRYALRASQAELQQVTGELYAIRGEIQEILYDRLDGKLSVSRIYERIRGVEARLKKVRFIVYWSKNIDLVADNPGIQRQLRREKATLEAAEKELHELLKDMRPESGGPLSSTTPEQEPDSGFDEEQADEGQEKR